jgi:O-antigen/teichoic acid export membrane protein
VHGQDLRLVLRGAALMLLMQVAAAALNYGSQVLLARWMGVFEFGLYAVAWSLVPPAAAVAAIGLPGASLRFVPQYLTRGDRGQLHGLIRQSVLLVLVVGLVAVAAGWGILKLIDPWMAEHYVQPIRVALFCVPFLTLIALVSDMSRGFGWAGLAYAPQWLLLPGLLIVGVAVHWVWLGQPSAVRVLQLALAACVVTAGLHLLFFRTLMSDEVFKTPPEYDTRFWLRVAIPLLFSDGVFLLLWSCDEVMLGVMTHPEEVAVYHACVKTAGLTLIFFNAIAAFASPRFAAQLISADRVQLQRFARSVSRWMFYPSSVVAAGLIVTGPFVLSVFGEDFVRGHMVLTVLTVGYLVRAVTGPVAAYLAVSDNQDQVVLVTACSALANIGLNLLLIPEWGALGAAWGSIGSIALCQLWMYVLVRRRLKIDTSIFARVPASGE